MPTPARGYTDPLLLLGSLINMFTLFNIKFASNMAKNLKHLFAIKINQGRFTQEAWYFHFPDSFI